MDYKEYRKKRTRLHKALNTARRYRDYYLMLYGTTLGIIAYSIIDKRYILIVFGFIFLYISVVLIRDAESDISKYKYKIDELIHDDNISNEIQYSKELKEKINGRHN